MTDHTDTTNQYDPRRHPPAYTPCDETTLDSDDHPAPPDPFADYPLDPPQRELAIAEVDDDGLIVRDTDMDEAWIRTDTWYEYQGVLPDGGDTDDD